MVPGRADASRREIDELTRPGQGRFGAKGLGASRGRRPARRPRPRAGRQVPRRGIERRRSVERTRGGAPAISSSSSPTPRVAAERPRPAPARNSVPRLGLADPAELAYCWVHRFPMYQWDRDGRAGTRPITRSGGSCPRTRCSSPPRPAIPREPVAGGPGRPGPGDAVRRRPQRLGARRRLGPDLPARAARAKLRAPGLRRSTDGGEFGGDADAFEYGAPPHGGIALGIDRWAALLADQTNIREVMAFPKTQSGRDLMLEAPSPPDPTQYAELGLRFVGPPGKA